VAERALPDLKTRVVVDTSQLTAAEGKAVAFGTRAKASMVVGTGGIKDFEKASASSSKVLGEAGRTMEGVTGKVGALAGLGGMGGLGIQTLVVAAGVGALAAGLGSAVEISEATERAQNNLAQAVAVTGGNYDKAKAQVQAFIDANRRYIPNQAQVIEGTAKLTREGLNQYQLQRDQNIALDLAATKNITYSEAVDIVAKAEAGRLRGLADLGVQTTHLTSANADSITKSKAISQVLDEVATKEKGGRETLTELNQAQNELSNDWQDIANRAGPPLILAFDEVVKGADGLVRKLEDLSNNKDWNHWVSLGLGQIQNQLIGVIQGFEKVVGFVQWLASQGGTGANYNPTGRRGGYGRQHGGPVMPGRIYDVGETAPEKLVMFPGGGGYVIPTAAPGGGGGGTSVLVQVQTNASASDIAAELGWELRKLRRFG
jgi:hypothetical protein